jgi:diguanylate cyclase (GGDEF)-like protein/PAS domain S-box-containing protein
VQDITDRKQTELELRIAATAFETQEGMTITDADGTILRVNSAFTSITGYSAEEIIGRNPRLLKSGRHDKSFYDDMWKSIFNTGVWKGEIWNKRKNGEIYPERLSITAVRGVDGAVTNYVATFTDIAEIRASVDEIKNLAFFDPLTKLPNRRLLFDRLQQAMASSARTGNENALLFIDLDNFKTLNDTLGHDIGDLLLQQVAERLVSCVRGGDTVARLGGDEFVVMLEDLNEYILGAAGQVESVGKKILDTIRKPYQIGTHECFSTPSIGITLFKGLDYGLEELLKQADIAMYQAKKDGRNTLRFFDPQMQNSINSRATLERELRNAIENQQLILYYQIQVDGSHRPTGAEALIRWLHPELGLVPPNQFIPMAEDTGVILPIGQWVLETACVQLKEWQNNELNCKLALSVNVSAKQFRQSNFVMQVQTIIKRHAINPKLLKLELTESLLLDNIEDTINTMNALNEIGVRFSLDDFGTGYSSLQYLKRLPLDQLKIDQSFVRDIATDNSDKAIVSTIIAMAKSLNLDVIAEGVETEEQRKFLKKNGCSNYQGYLFGKPVPIDKFELQLTQLFL